MVTVKKHGLTTSFTKANRFLSGLMAGLVFMLISFTCGSMIKGIAASAQTEQTDYKYFKSVRISAGDTLYSIADSYYSQDYYDDMEEYLKEVCRTNHIDDRNSLVAGDHIIMPYYAAYVAFEDVVQPQND